LAIITESRFERTPDGRIWSQTLDPKFWDRYLAVFETLKVVARVEEIENPLPGSSQISSPSVRFHVVPYYLGPSEYAKNVYRLEQALKCSVDIEDAVIMRIGSMLAARIEPVLHRRGQPYGVEVVGDPYDVFAPGAVAHPLRPFLRWFFSRQIRRFCSKAVAVGYVTENALQRRYPPSSAAFTTHYSSIDLDRNAFHRRPSQSLIPSDEPFRILMVGSLEQLYKAPDVLLEAFAICHASHDAELTIVGDGRYRRQLEEQAVSLGIRNRVTFTGTLPAGEAIQQQLDRAHLFVLPSRTEGLPRAMIEAMARGLPCIGTNVGGMPELLPEDALVPPGNAAALAGRISALIDDSEKRLGMSRQNLEKAQEYRRDILERRRTELYRALRQRTEEWQQGRS
jgi:glycosyltransferase involved in cell wall biosynthesis